MTVSAAPAKTVDAGPGANEPLHRMNAGLGTCGILDTKSALLALDTDRCLTPFDPGRRRALTLDSQQ